VIVAAHPAAIFGDETARLLGDIAGVEARCVDVTQASTFEAMIDELEDVRRRDGIERWLFWGMSGGGWLAQLYAHRHPESLTGIIVESACACFRERIRDPECVVERILPQADELMKKQMPLLLTFDSRPWLGEVRVPALVIAGDADPVAPLRHVRAVRGARRDPRIDVRRRRRRRARPVCDESPGRNRSGPCVRG
jgi:pimeloyl-ACP methyl ester carboxylesterase